MPPIARWIGLLLLLANPRGLAGQSYQPNFADANPSTTQRHSSLPEARPSWPKRPPTPDQTAGHDTRLNLPPRRTPLALAPPSQRSQSGTMPSPRGFYASIPIFSSLGIVLGLFFLLAWFMRRTQPGSTAHLPGEVIETLGRMPLAGRQQLHLLRCGNRLLLVSVTPTGAETLTEITDQDEVNRLIELCHRNQPGSATDVFRQVFGQFANATDADTYGEPEHASMGNRDA